MEGPPGTGKTETILNLIASVIADGGKTVAVVSFSNAAVDNVRDKLDELGFGHVIASLGRKDKREQFLANQGVRNGTVDTFTAGAPPRPSDGELAGIDRRLRGLQDAERIRAVLRQEIDAHRLEMRHFDGHLERDELPELTEFPLLHRSADRILDFLAETAWDGDRPRPGVIRRIRRYFRYGSLRGLDPGDTSVVLRLQQAYYQRHIADLDEQISRLDEQLRAGDFDRLAREHQRLSTEILHAELASRYRGVSRDVPFHEDTYRLGTNFTKFVADYPVVLSTCHSIRNSIPPGYLFDYLVIDEASQVDLMTASLALSCCRNLVVVGDRRQLAPVTQEVATDLVAPDPAYDHRQSLLTSLTAVHRDSLPQVLLREHYRCAPAIIGFCNKKFYDGDLVPYTSHGGDRPMIVVRTVPGQHMRRHRQGGNSNQRELDVILEDVIPQYCSGVAHEDIGVATPYRLQADKAADLLDQSIEANTVHKFQGRQKDTVIMTTVLDQTRWGRMGLRFADDPLLVNVAVSRAVRRFVLVIEHGLLPASRNLRDLIGYIRYHDPDHEVEDSTVVSIFDLLYDAYSARLRRLAARVGTASTYPSENIASTVLDDILAEDRYAHLRMRAQILLRNLLPDTSRLDERQRAFVRRRASVDFVVYNRISNAPLLAIEVDGFAYHENDPVQLARDAIKDAILEAHRLPLLRLPTTGSGEIDRIRRALDRAEAV
nr:AAA domain-containing protein [Pseudonocardia sp. HH130630-07]